MAELIEWNGLTFRCHENEKVELVTFTESGQLLPWLATQEEKEAVLSIMREQKTKTTKKFYEEEWSRLVDVPNSQERAYQLLLDAATYHGDVWASAAHMDNYHYFNRLAVGNYETQRAA